MNVLDPGLPHHPEPARQAFRRLLLGMADTKRILGIRYSDWLLGAPSIEAGIAASSMAQDEWGHARLLYATLKDFGADPEALEHDRHENAYASWDPLDEPLPDWAWVTATMMVVDGGLSVALEGILEGAYEPLQGRMQKMLGEEEFHEALAEAWFTRLASSQGEGRVHLKSAVEAVLPATLSCLAPGDEAHAVLAEEGLFPGAEALRSRLAARLDPSLSHLGMSVPLEVALDEGWDSTRGRGPGHPGLEAVERARGDRNRALFVE